MEKKKKDVEKQIPTYPIIERPTSEQSRPVASNLHFSNVFMQKRH